MKLSRYTYNLIHLNTVALLPTKQWTKGERKRIYDEEIRWERKEKKEQKNEGFKNTSIDHGKDSNELKIMTKDKRIKENSYHFTDIPLSKQAQNLNQSLGK